jgi:hypothetical protein
MITVKVCAESNGRPVKNTKVALGFDGLFRGVAGDEWTDSNGEAHFDCETGKGKVFVGGQTVYRGQLSGRIIVYVCMRKLVDLFAHISLSVLIDQAESAC